MILLSLWQMDWFIATLGLAGVAASVQRRSWSLFGATAVAMLALASPIGVLARGYLFSAHMLQHILLVLIVPQVLMSGLRPLRLPAIPIGVAWLLGVGAMWFWHAPTLCDAASRSLMVQRFQTLSLIAMGCAFWSPVIRERLSPFGAIAYLFAGCVACTVLGIWVTFSPVEVCSVYAHPVDALGILPLLRDGWGLSAKADQQIGGLLMWVPGCLVYAGSILVTYGRYVGGELGEAR